MSNLIYAPNTFALQTGDPSTPITGLGNFYLKFSDSEVHTFTKDELGNIRRISLPSGTNGYVLKHNGTNWISNDDLKITTTEVVINDIGSALMDFRVESDSFDHIIFVQSATNVIGINNDTPSSENIIDISGNKPVKLPTVTSLNISLINKEVGQILHNKSDRGFIGLSDGIENIWRRLDNPLNHTGHGIVVVTTTYNIQPSDHLIICDLSFLLNFTVYLPASPKNEQTYIIKRINGYPGLVITINGNGYNIDNTTDIYLAPTAMYLQTSVTLVFSSMTNQWHKIANMLD